jgi:magnesium-protoporphyrin O-methyltransferase
MNSASYQTRRGELQTYFDRTAVEAWARLTSTAPVSRIRATVRAGRDRMRDTLLGMLPEHLGGSRILDAGCGTGALAVQAARRGASVVAVDISPTLVALAQERLPALIGGGRVAFSVGDMFDAQLGEFDHVVAMDSLIHYRRGDVVSVLAGLAARTRHSIVFTFAPRTPALSLMWVVGRLFPRKDRAPAIEPISEKALRSALTLHPGLSQWRIGRTQRIESAFYKSQAMELVKS